MVEWETIPPTKKIKKGYIKMDFFIVGDFNICGKIQSCLIVLCANEEQARQKLEEIKTNPPADCLGNIHIKSEAKQRCWWNQGNLD
jgi:hypothetical protein